jgi:hypothetical protein
MADRELLTAKYFKPDEGVPSTRDDLAIQESPPPQASPLAAWVRASRWISAIAGAAVVACVIVLVVPSLRSALSIKATSPIDWLIRLGGGRSDQIFEKAIRDRSEANQREWQESYRKSTYQLDPTKPIEWRFEPPANFK